MLTPALILDLQDHFIGRAKLQEAVTSIKCFTKGASLFYSCIDGWGKKKYVNIPIEPSDIIPILEKYINNIEKDIMQISNRVEVHIENMEELTASIEDYRLRFPTTFTSIEKIISVLEESISARVSGDDWDVMGDYHIPVCSDWEDKLYVFSVLGYQMNKFSLYFKEIFKQ